MTKLTKAVPAVRVDDDTYAQIMQRVDEECARLPYATRTDVLRDVLKQWSCVSRETKADAAPRTATDAK